MWQKKKSLSQRLPILYSAAFVIISLQTYKVFIHLFQADLHKAKVKDFHSLHCTCLMWIKLAEKYSTALSSFYSSPFCAVTKPAQDFHISLGNKSLLPGVYWTRLWPNKIRKHCWLQYIFGINLRTTWLSFALHYIGEVCIFNIG